MPRELSEGAEAPNFDLSSTEDAVLMLRDEVPRNLVLLYFFADVESDAARTDLTALARAHRDLTAKKVKILGVAAAKMPVLKQLQSDLDLPFPLLRDDREFSRAYGVAAPDEEGVGSPALVLVGRDQRVLWVRNPLESVEPLLGELAAAVDARESSTRNYPKSVINRLVDRWVN